jgi:capping protein alpha
VIQNSPFGEIKEVLEDLSKLIDNFSVSDSFIQRLLREHNENHMAIVRGDNDYTFVLTPVSYQDGWYVDQQSNIRIRVDQLTYRVLESEQVEIQKNPAFEQYREAINKNLAIYLASYYKDTLSGYQTYIDWDDDNFTFYVALTSKYLNLKNFHGGEWISEWVVNSEGMQGKIRINSHYFEDGNVALKDIRKIHESITFSGQIEEEARQIVQMIQDHEQKIQKSLENIYENMDDTFFKQMRRKMPVTNQKMLWNLDQIKMRAGIKI